MSYASKKNFPLYNHFNWYLVVYSWFIVLNATFNNIPVISWRSVLLVEKTRVPGKKLPTCRKSLTNFIT